MSELYNAHTTKILELWLQRLSTNADVDPMVIEHIQRLIVSGQASSESKIQELIASLKEKANEPH